LADKVKESVDNYYNIQDDMLDIYVPLKIDSPECFLNKTVPGVNDTLCPISLEATYYND